MFEQIGDILGQGLTRRQERRTALVLVAQVLDVAQTVAAVAFVARILVPLRPALAPHYLSRAVKSESLSARLVERPIRLRREYNPWTVNLTKRAHSYDRIHPIRSQVRLEMYNCCLSS